MVATKTNLISLEEYNSIEESMAKKGYFSHEYVMPERTVITDVKCPVCNANLSLNRLGNSHRIFCTEKSCVNETVRGL